MSNIQMTYLIESVHCVICPGRKADSTIPSGPGGWTGQDKKWTVKTRDDYVREYHLEDQVVGPLHSLHRE